MRKFNTGATRNDDTGKLDYEGFLSAPVLRRYAHYLNKHRKQADGNLRTADNWQKLFGEEHFNVCMKSAWRHFMSWWLQHRGFDDLDTIEDSICALIFNATAYLHKIEIERENNAG